MRRSTSSELSLTDIILFSLFSFSSSMTMWVKKKSGITHKKRVPKRPQLRGSEKLRMRMRASRLKKRI